MLRPDPIRSLFIAHLVSSVMYHADRDKGKSDLHGGRRYTFVEYKGQNHVRIELELKKGTGWIFLDLGNLK